MSDYNSYHENLLLPAGKGTANATLVFLARNSDLSGVLNSMRHLEDKFNKEYGYPWVFLNEEEFDGEFKSAVQKESSAPISFGLIPKEHWYQPDWIDEEKATEGRAQMQAANIIYAGIYPSFPFENELTVLCLR
ncbi:hypothetical protein HHX47_DHR5000548 [Lentinula edodes]|nr:hypothetical protein HHX47_DHR5000548 [Lentinula edodes]